jgi:hypothetical protein
MLDCYRVVLDQRPPLLSSNQTISATSTDLDQFGSTIYALLSEEQECPRLQDYCDSLTALSALAALTWNVVPPAFMKHTPLKRLWSSSFIEQALHRWVSAHNFLPPSSVMILFHLIHINICLCLPALQLLVVRAFGPDSGARAKPVEGADHMARDSELSRKKLDDLKMIFPDPSDRPKAVWHALQILEQARLLLEDTQNSASFHEDDDCPRARVKPPHFSFCVVYAVLTLWSDSQFAKLAGHPQRKDHWPQMGIDLIREKDSSAIERLHRAILVELVACEQETS